MPISSYLLLTRRQWAIPNRDARSQSKKLMMEALALAVIRVISTPLPAVMTLRLLLLEEEMRGVPDLEEPRMNGVLRPQLRRSEEEDKTAGRYRLPLHPFRECTLLVLRVDLNGTKAKPVLRHLVRSISRIATIPILS